MKFEARVEEFLVWRTGYFEAGKKRDLNKGGFLLPLLSLPRLSIYTHLGVSLPLISLPT